MTDLEPVGWTRLGSSGLKISKIIIGCMSFGKKSWADWVMEDEEKIFSMLKHAYDRGMRTYDTADMYSNGYSEILLAKFFKRYNIKRDKVVIMTKVYNEIDEDMEILHGKKGPEVRDVDLINSKGLSRKHIMDGVEGSVKRLGTYIDLLQIHRYDHETPPEETMRALHDVIESGQVRYIGASTMLGVEFAELQFIAEKHGWTKFISMQNLYNLLYREEEREMIPFCKKHGVGIIPWSPNARGVLTRPLSVASERQMTDRLFGLHSKDSLSEAEVEIVKRVEEIASKKNMSMAMVSCAWVLHKGCHPVVGLNSIKRVDEAIAATTVKLTEEEVAHLEEPYKPQQVKGF